MLPPVSNEKVALYLNNSDVYISASLSDGTSVSMLEAMACKLPVIVTDLPSSKEWIKNGFNGFLPGKKNILELAKSILTLILDDEKRDMMAQRNLDIVKEKADWQEHIITLEEEYRKNIK